jgi:hypothetical protein
MYNFPALFEGIKIIIHAVGERNRKEYIYRLVQPANMKSLAMGERTTSLPWQIVNNSLLNPAPFIFLRTIKYHFASFSDTNGIGEAMEALLRSGSINGSKPYGRITTIGSGYGLLSMIGGFISLEEMAADSRIRWFVKVSLIRILIFWQLSFAKISNLK